MSPAIEKIKEKCAGCFACYNVCPQNAINMELSPEGFYVPKVNESCTNCELCEISCPVLSYPQLERYSTPITYASWNKDEKVRMKSSSGGIFSELAKTIIEKGGVVCGVIWDNNFSPKHERATNKKTLEKMRGSKYVPSHVGDAYNRVVEDLKNRKPVLFSGTPCQVAALNKIIEEKNVDETKLFTAEIVCHGVPSLVAFHKYLKYISKGKIIKNISFRNKGAGWSKYQVKIEFEDSSFYTSKHYKDPFLIGFLQNLYLNTICYECPFSKIPRQGDITLGDFWGAPKDLKNEKGVSTVLVNSKKGDELLEQVKGLELVEVPINIAVKGNPRITSGKLSKPEIKGKMLEVAKKEDFDKILKIITREKRKRRVIFLVKLPILAFRKILRDLSYFVS